jgi:hypothetical protein
MKYVGILLIVGGVLWIINSVRKPYKSASSNLNTYFNFKDVVYGILITVGGVILIVMYT